MWAHIEWLCHSQKCSVGIIRTFEDDKKWGDPYTFCCTVKMDSSNKELLEFKGITKEPTLTEFRSMSKFLGELGFKTAVWYRIKNNEIKQRLYKIPKKWQKTQG